MQLHNHRVAMNTRLGHRYGIHRLNTQEEITPCNGVQVGNSSDTYTFIPNATNGMLLVLNKNARTSASWYGVPIITGAKIVGNSTYAQNGRFGTANPWAAELGEMVPGQPVTITFPDLSTDGKPFWQPGRCMMAIMGATPGVTNPTKGWYWASSNGANMGASVGVDPSVPWTDPSEALLLIATTTLARGMPVVSGITDYYNHTSELQHIICSGTNVDNVPTVPGVRTGGFYKYALFKTSGRNNANGYCRVQWNAPNETEEGASWAYIFCMKNPDATLTGWFPKS